MNENIFYVYKYFDPNTDEPFYIGKGCGNRYCDIKGHSYNKHLYNKIQKLRKKYKVKDFTEFIYEKINNDTALSYEIKLINKIGRKDFNKGPLLNHTNGGDGVKGLKNCILYHICDDHKTLNRMVNEHKTQVEIAKYYNCSKSTLINAAKIVNIKFKGRKLKLNERDIVNYYLINLSIPKTSKLFKCDRDVIMRILKENNVKIYDSRKKSNDRGGKFKTKLDDKTRDIITLYNNKNSAYKLSKIYNVDRSVIINILHNNNISIRDDRYKT